MSDEAPDLDVELQQLLAGDHDDLDDEEDDNHWLVSCTDVDSLAAFIAEIKETPGVTCNATLTEVPVRFFVEGQQAGLVTGLETHDDDLGRPFLLALVVPTGDGGQIVLVSRSLEEVVDKGGEAD